MFQFRRFPTSCYFIHKRLTEYCSAGFPHSDIHGSMPAFDSPWLFVDRYVLHRLPMPRHSPCALISLTFSNYVSLLFSTRLYCSLSYPLIFSEKFKASNICYIISLFPFHISCIQFSRYIFDKLLSQSILVGLRGLEPPTSRLSGVRSNHLSYKPMYFGSSSPNLWWR